MTHICVGTNTNIGSDNGLSPGRRQAIIWTNSGILLIGPLGTNFSGILSEIHIFSFKKIHLKMSSGKWRPFCLGLNVLIHRSTKNQFPVILWHEVWTLLRVSFSRVTYFRNCMSKNPWWRHQMETFSALLALCAENSPVTGEFPAQRPVTRSFDVFFDVHLNKQLSKQPNAGDLRCCRAHYDVSVMCIHHTCHYLIVDPWINLMQFGKCGVWLNQSLAL